MIILMNNILNIFIIYYLLSMIYYLLFIIYYLLFIIYYLLWVISKFSYLHLFELHSCVYKFKPIVYYIDNIL